MSPVRDVEEIERPLAQALEGWVLQQAVTGLMFGGQLEQAEALCSQVGYEQAQSQYYYSIVERVGVVSVKNETR